MGAWVVNEELKATRWSAVKPKDYGGKDLDNALKAFEKIDLNKVPVPRAPVDVPPLSISKIDTAVKDMNADIKVLEAAKKTLQQAETAANTVCSAANKTNAELQKVIKDKKTGDDQKKKFQAAADVASAMASKATTLIGKIK
jgi:hypothetical protein